MDESVKKAALRLFTYGLYAVSTGTPDRWNAFTANWVSQVSFDPPLVVVSVENTSVSLPIIRDSGHFAVHVFADEQRDLAGTLGKTFARHPEKLNGLTFQAGDTGCPRLLDTLGWVECEVVNEMPAGDSTLVLGRVTEAGISEQTGAKEPLTMRAAGFRHAG
jgi:flavin reductase (DIM6/NTAB) family NADH-FMN oxidoreductase RutF